MDVDYGNDINHLRHFVAVDHANRKVVLSVRGTFTLSEIVVDVAGFSRKLVQLSVSVACIAMDSFQSGILFLRVCCPNRTGPCFGGEAHSEMYTMAERVWSAAGGTITKMLKE